MLSPASDNCCDFVVTSGACVVFKVTMGLGLAEDKLTPPVLSVVEDVMVLLVGVKLLLGLKVLVMLVALVVLVVLVVLVGILMVLIVSLGTFPLVTGGGPTVAGASSAPTDATNNPRIKKEIDDIVSLIEASGGKSCKI